MFTLVAGYASITNGTVYGAIAGVLDQSMTLDAGNRFAAPGNWQLMAAYGLGVNATAMRVNAPSMRGLYLPEIYPVNATAAVPTLDGPVVWGQRGPRFAPQEYFTVEGSRAGASAQPMAWGLWLGPDMSPAQVGPTFTAIATVNLTAVAGSWVLGSLTFSSTLPAGRYQVVGMAVVAAGSAFARLVFPGLSQYRPGVVVQTAYGDRPWTNQWRYGAMGQFGEFLHNAPPSIEVLGLAAGAITPTVYLDLIKVG